MSRRPWRRGPEIVRPASIAGTGGSSEGPVQPPPPPPMPPDPPPRPRSLRSGPFGVLDVGSTKVCCLIGRIDPDGAPRVDGFGVYASRGVRLGGIVDIDQAKDAVLSAVASAEQMAGHRLSSVIVNLSCGQPASHLLDLQWPVDGRTVTSQDLRRAMQEARDRSAFAGRDIVHALPLDFTVDETGGVVDPRHLHCHTLQADWHIVHAGSTACRNLLTTLAAAELDASELVNAPIAAGLATLDPDERELGTTVIDMGGGTTGIAVFKDGHVIFTHQEPWGGIHVTSDIARGLNTTLAHAERLKTLYGNAEASPDDEREMLPVPLVGEEEHALHKVPRSQVVQIIGPRVSEIFERVRDAMVRANLNEMRTGSRVVLTGGASQLGGVREMAARILGRQVRLGRPVQLRGRPDLHDGPAFATAAGLLAWASGAGRSLPDLDLAEQGDTGLVRRIIDFLRDRV